MYESRDEKNSKYQEIWLNHVRGATIRWNRKRKDRNCLPKSVFVVFATFMCKNRKCTECISLINLLTMVNSIITYTLSIYNQPPKSRPR